MSAVEKEVKREGIGDVFSPGVVKILCGCNEARRARCSQKGSYVGEAGAVNPNPRCFVYVDEIDLIELTHDVVKARFEVTRQRDRRRGIKKGTPVP